MNSDKIKKDYYRKINLIKKYNANYYDKSKPLVDDGSYDSLKKEITNLEKKYSFLKSEQSPTEIIGYKPSKNFKKALHRVPMLSLANAFSEEDLIKF